ncbi:hypothetical protein ACOYQJ_17750 [Primorskyibacter sp. 2E233]
MNTPNFGPADKALRWGNEAINEFDINCRSFFDNGPLREVRQKDLESGQIVVKVISTADIPDSAEKQAFYAIQCIKNSFDRATYAACIAFGAILTGNTSVNCPWADSAAGTEGILNGRSSKFPPKLRPIIHALQPYGTGQGYTGGDDISRQLAKIANRKHTVDLTFLPNVSGFMLLKADFSTDGKSGALQLRRPRWDSMKNECEIMRLPGDVYDVPEYRLGLDVVFDESGPIFEIPAVKALRHFAGKAKAFIQALELEAKVM